jgi:SAM-dependent methyltransferase
MVAAGAIDGLSGLPEAVCAGLRAHFAAAGFSAALIEEAELFAPGVLLGPRLPLLRWWLGRRPEPGAALARLFTYQDTLSDGEARAALGPDLFDPLLDAGVLRVGAAGIQAGFTITPVDEGLWLLSDPLAAGPDAVMGPGGGTQHLARLLPRSFRGAALDVGCGAGSLALVAARLGARRAVGVDVNPRAIEIARFNARLNDLQAEFFAGDAVEPVSTQRFDLVLSQPPFVMRPPDQSNLTYLFGGPSGDELPRRFVSSASRVLAPGGRALILLQSAERDGDPLAARMRSALAGVAVDLLVIGMPAPSRSVQASVFASYDDPGLSDRYAAAVRRYLDHFEALGVREFTGALVILGNPVEPPPAVATGGGPPRRYTIGLKLSHPQYDATSLDQFLRGLDLIGLPPEGFEQTRLRISPHARLMTETSGREGATDEQIVLRVEPPGIGTDWPVSKDDLQVLDAITDADSLRAAIDACASARRVPAVSVRHGLLAFAKNALVTGALVRADVE